MIGEGDAPVQPRGGPLMVRLSELVEELGGDLRQAQQRPSMTGRQLTLTHQALHRGREAE